AAPRRTPKRGGSRVGGAVPTLAQGGGARSPRRVNREIPAEANRAETAKAGIQGGAAPFWLPLVGLGYHPPRPYAEPPHRLEVVGERRGPCRPGCHREAARGGRDGHCRAARPRPRAAPQAARGARQGGARVQGNRRPYGG